MAKYEVYSWDELIGTITDGDPQEFEGDEVRLKMVMGWVNKVYSNDKQAAPPSAKKALDYAASKTARNVFSIVKVKDAK